MGNLTDKKRCKWVNVNNNKYIYYHDNEWGKPVYDDNKLFEALVLEIFQAGLSFECVLNKREEIKKAFDNYNLDKIASYDDKKICELMKNSNIIRNKLKIKAIINNAKIFNNIKKEYKGFYKFIWSFTNNKIIYETNKTYSSLSDKIYKVLKQKGMKFLGSITVYSYLQAIGVIYSHEDNCYLSINNIK